MKSARLPLALLISSLLLPVSAGADQAHDLYQQALVAERAAGDLKRAISLYEKVVAAAGSDRELAAKALIQIGRAYETLGRSEAKRAYLRVVQEFGDQSSAVATARARLASLDQPSTVAQRTRTRSSRMVWDRLLDNEGEVSRDRRLFSFVDWETGDMAIRDLEKGTSRRLTDKGSWEQSPQFGGASRISPDGKWVAYTWYDEEKVVDLRLIGTDGSSPRTLYREQSVEYVEPGHFAPDGRHVLAGITRRDKTGQIGIIGVEDGRLRVLASFEGRHAHPVSFSPDGRWVVFHVPPRSGVGQNDVFVIPAAGGTPRVVAPHSTNDRAAGFSPDGKKIVFVSWRSGEPALWAVDFHPDGRDSEPRLLDSQIGMGALLGMSDDGSLYYEVRRGNHEGYLVDLDAGGKPAGAPRRIGEAIGTDRYPNFSNDGREFLYTSSRGAGNPMRPRENVYVLRDLASGRERTVPARVAAHFQGFSWSPVRKMIAVAGHYLSEPGLFLVNAETGDVEKLESVKNDERQFYPVWSADGKALYYLDVNGRNRVIKRRDMESGDTAIVFETPGRELINGLAVSPDGRWLAFRRSQDIKHEVDWLQVIPAAGGEPRDVLREPVRRKGANINGRAGLAWTPDGKHIVFGRWEGWSMANQNVALFRVPAAGGPSEKLGITMPQIWAMRLSPDGRTLGFTSGDPENELWVLENFLP